MALFNEVTLPLAKEQILIVIGGTYIYNIDTDVYDPLEAPTFGVVGALTSENKITRQFTEGVDFNFSSNQITFLNDDIFAYGYFVFKITDDTISRRNALDGSNLDIFKGEVQEEVDYILTSINVLKDDIIKKRVLTLENSLYNEVSLPMGKVGQAWYFTGTDIGLFDVASAEETKLILDDYVNSILFPRMDDYVTDPLEPRLDAYVEDTSKPSLDAYVISDSQPQIDTYVDTVTKPDIDAFTNVKKNELQVLVDSAILDNGVLAPASDIHLAYYGYWWTDDVTGLVNAPPTDLLGGIFDGQISIKESDGDSQGSGSNPPLPRTNATYIFRGTGGITLYQIQTGETLFTDWMPLGASESIVPYANTDLVDFPTGIVRGVYWDGVDWKLAYGNLNCSGIAIRTTATSVNVYLSGTIILDASDLDADGDPFIDHDYYFLPNLLARAGKFEVDKPTDGIFQTLARIYTIPGSAVKYMKVEIEEPKDITPLVFTDQGETQVVLRPTFDEYNKLKEYNTLDELGLVAPVATQDIIDAMEDSSSITFSVEPTTVNDLPSAQYGTLIITKINVTRVSTEFVSRHDTTNTREKHIGFSDNGIWYGWQPIGLATLRASDTLTIGSFTMKALLNSAFGTNLEPSASYKFTYTYNTSGTNKISVIFMGATNASGVVATAYQAMVINSIASHTITRVTNDFNIVITGGSFGITYLAEPNVSI